MNQPVPVRVKVLDAWDEIALEAEPTDSIAHVKREALQRARVHRSAESYELKFNGGIVNESDTLAEAGIGANAALIVLPRRRQPVR